MSAVMHITVPGVPIPLARHRSGRHGTYLPKSSRIYRGARRGRPMTFTIFLRARIAAEGAAPPSPWVPPARRRGAAALPNQRKDTDDRSS